MVDGARRMHQFDQALLGQGIAMFEALYRSNTKDTKDAKEKDRKGTS
jgi:hypothetical protein